MALTCSDLETKTRLRHQKYASDAYRPSLNEYVFDHLLSPTTSDFAGPSRVMVDAIK